MKSALVAILNFNGSRDTIACVESFYMHEEKDNYTVVIMDNGSEYDDWIYLKNRISDLRNIKSAIIEYDEYFNCDILQYDMVLVKNNSNLGFAAGNNAIIRPHKEKFKYVILLNNDTELVSSSSKSMLNYLANHPETKVISTSIHFYHDQDKIWNAGGRIFLGTRRYYTEKYVNDLLAKSINVLKVDFITGCYMAIRSIDVEAKGLFTEKFFHGEEDYNFAMRNKGKHAMFVVLLNEKLLHKVGATVDKGLEINDVVARSMPHHLNRFIDMKSFYSTFYWNIWRYISSLYIWCMIYKNLGNFMMSCKYVYDLNYFARKMDGVGREDFFMIRANKIKELKLKYK